MLTWRNGYAEDLDATLFTDLCWPDEAGRTHQWRVADTTVDLPVGEHDQVFTMRQVTLLVAGNTTGRQQHPTASTATTATTPTPPPTTTPPGWCPTRRRMPTNRS